VEGDAAALSALDRAFRFASGLKRVTGERRDLFRRPLTFRELNAFDGVVFDPPRAGAEDQSKQIARSDVPLVAAVSCNPVTLARDLRILVDGGYALKSVTPIDQFLWSPHVEAVALLEKPKRRR
ncbi:MAG: RNA methyltransferase, partial [Mesorhizobium sp.]